jgi:short-subunit dehydrogenase
MKNLNDKVAVITGAGSGIGRALACGLAEKGCHIAISDVDQAGLEETAGQIAKKNVRVTTHIVDVADKDQVYQHAKDVAETHGRVNILINNAGVALGDSLEEVEYDNFEWIFGINFWGVVYGTKAFLPYLNKATEGHIVNISSINGIIPNPYNGPYCATKFAVKGFTECLSQELHGTSIGVTVVHPGGIKTNIARNAKMVHLPGKEFDPEKAVRLFEEKLFKTTAKEAARVIISGIERNKERVMIGSDAKIIDWMVRLFPVFSKNLVGRMTYRLVE